MLNDIFDWIDTLNQECLQKFTTEDGNFQPCQILNPRIFSLCTSGQKKGTYQPIFLRLCADYEFLNQMLDAPEQFMEVEPLGVKLAWTVIKKWMVSAGRDLNNYQWRVVANAIQECSLPIFLKLVIIFKIQFLMRYRKNGTPLYS